MFASLVFVIGLSVGVCLGFVLFAALEMSRKVDANVMSNEDTEAIAP